MWRPRLGAWLLLLAVLLGGQERTLVSGARFTAEGVWYAVPLLQPACTGCLPVFPSGSATAMAGCGSISLHGGSPAPPPLARLLTRQRGQQHIGFGPAYRAPAPFTIT